MSSPSPGVDEKDAPGAGPSVPVTEARTLVILNPSAGGGRVRALAQRLARVVATHPNAARTPVRLLMPDSVQQACLAVARLPPGSRVLVVGGDGSINRLLPELLRSNHELGIVPAGSGNDAARALGLRRMGPEAALHHALSAPARRVDLGLAHLVGPGRVASDAAVPFLSSLTAGFDAAVGHRAMQGPGWLRGMPRYLVATLRELAVLRNRSLRVQVEGRTLHDGPLLFASTLNTATYAGGMPCVPHARLHDGQLDLLLAGPFGRTGTLFMLPLLLMGRHLGHPGVRCSAATDIELVSTEPVPIAADGEYLGEHSRVRIQVLPAALSVVHGADENGSPRDVDAAIL